MELIFLSILACVFAAVLFFAYRNQCIYSARSQILWRLGNRDECWAVYEKLPEYYASVLHPKYWLLWTSGHWVEWANHQSSNQSQGD